MGVEVGELRVLLVEVELEEFEELSVGEVIQGLDQFVGDVDVKEGGLFGH
jgi:hypothetical protein